MKIDEACKGVSRLAFDTALIIYFVEANPAYDKLVSNDSSISLCDLCGPLCLCGEHSFAQFHHRDTETHRVSQRICWPNGRAGPSAEYSQEGSR